MNLLECRKQIDAVDAELVRLFMERMNLSAEISEYKKANGLPVWDPQRERQKMFDIMQQTPEKLKDYMSQLYAMIFEMSKSYQNHQHANQNALADRIRSAIENTPKLFPESVSVACQGVEGANSQFACEKLFRNANIMFFSSFDAVFTAIEKGLCRYGVIPVENSTAGSVNSVYDLMLRHDFSIVRSIRVKIEHNLLSKQGVKLEEIREIYSHEQAISQCSAFLDSLNNVRIIPCENTAAAAKRVSESDRADIAALASRPCMKYYGLHCLKSAVQNTDHNYTRFICISKDTEIFPGADRTSLMVTLPHEQGSLYRFLSRLYALGINLLKLESRPLPNREFEFMFYFDIETPVYAPRLLQLIGELPEACEDFHYLGSYSEVI